MNRKRSEQQKAYREANRDKIREQRKAYREANRDLIKARRKKYYEANKDQLKAKSKAHYHENREKMAARNKAWSESNPEKMKQYKAAYRQKTRHCSHRDKARWKYGITSEQYTTLVEETQGKCPICQTLLDWIDRNKANRPCIDHCHKTGKVRGIICAKCNAAIGQLGDDVVILNRAVRWLQSR